MRVASKTISLSTDAYERLRLARKAGESFSDVVNRLTQRRSPVEFIGAWKHVPDADIDAMKRRIATGKRSGDRKFRAKLARWRR